MQLIPFQSNKKKKQAILVVRICLILLVAGVILYRTYSLFEESKNYNVIKGSVPDYLENYDVKVNFKLDGIAINTVPVQDGGKTIESIVCDKNAKGIWNYKEWNFSVHNLKQTRTTCNVSFVTRYVEDNLNGTDPIVNGGLIPVTIEDNGTVKKADMKSKWYDYSNQWWANAVILNDESINYNNGEEIPEDNIESYFVWIPRYRYQIFDEGNYSEQTTVVSGKTQLINIEFQNRDMDVSDGSTVGSWLTHPAFMSFDTNGMWVGKFETGYKGANSTSEAEKNINDSTKAQIKPNVYSWRGINVSNAYLSSYNYKREYDSHMMKNTEWGAVAYLQHSTYGSGNVSVRINNNEAYITGYAAKNEPTCGLTRDNRDCNKYESTVRGVDGTYTVNYFNLASVVASTTNNYSGVYDMSGGAWECVMGVMLYSDNATECSGSDATDNSGFVGRYCNTGQNGSLDASAGGKFFPDSKYYDKYAYGTINERYNRRILGDATGEMGPFQTRIYDSSRRQIGSWHDDEAFFVYSSVPWFVRGGGFYVGSNAGVFDFDSGHGSSYTTSSFRIVLV